MSNDCQQLSVFQSDFDWGLGKCEKPDTDVKLIVIDSFCGAGGVTEGFHRAELNSKKIAKVIIGINHDEIAIKSHAANHPETIHFIEDFTELDPNKLKIIIEHSKVLYPNAKVLFWMSAECTHHSIAKGGMPRNADSRSLPEFIYNYIEILHPDIIGVENVKEFISWGPLDQHGKPIKEQKGIYFNQWKTEIINHGYKYDHKILNAADYGAYTSRRRYFGIFSLDTIHINFPTKTHSKDGELPFKKWNAVRDVLNLDYEGDSIFIRNKPLCDATIDRVTNGIIRFVIGGKKDFMIKYNSMNQQGKYKAPSVDEPCPTVSCQSRIGVVKAITMKSKSQMITAYYGNGFNSSIEEPCPTITTKDRFALVSSKFIDEQYGNGRATDINSPSGTITTCPKQNVVTAQWLMDTELNNTEDEIRSNWPQKKYYLMNPQFDSKGGDVEKPCFTLIARMDKMPPYLVEAEFGQFAVPIHNSDSKKMMQLKQIMAINGIIDIKMRMLSISELKRIMGFGDDYILEGTKANQKKFIGNAVECKQSKVLAESIAITI